MKTKVKPTFKPVALAALALVVMHGAQAQQAPAAQESGDKPAAQPAAKLDAVVVSGSRIKRDAFSSAAPIQVIKNEDAALAGFTSTAQVLQSTTVTSGQGQINNAFGGFVTDGGPGANTIGLRGFGATRSLVLLNGRRMSPSGTRGSVGASDLNTLPNSIVDRIEVLKDGASSIYGSDAVAGVINIITKKNLSTFTVDASLSATAEGGGNAKNVAVSGGHVGDLFRISGAYNFNESDGLTLGQRDWARCNTDYRRTSAGGVVGEWGSGDFIDPLTGKPKCYPITTTGSNGVTINTIGTSNAAGVGAPGSVGTTFNRWRPNSGVTTGLVGWEGVGGGSNNLNVRDTFDPRTLNRTMLSPVRNHNVFVQGGMDLPALGDAELYFEILRNRRESSQVGYRQLSLDYAKGSPLIPANLAFSTLQTTPTLITNGAAMGVRAFVGAGNSYSSQEVDFTRVAAGLRGTLPGINWDYDVSVTSSDSKGTYVWDGFLTDRLAQSLDVVASGSTFVCRNAANGCVAAPALSSSVVGGVLPQAWLNFVYSNNIAAVTKFKEDIVTASATGTVFQLPYGAVKAAFGAEFRRNSIDDTPSVDQQTGNIYNFTSSGITRGKDQATDVFAEVEVPLLKNLPFAQDLSLNASSRIADYRSYGSDSTYKVGVLWTPVKWLSLRGTNGTSYRAPALFEQFVGATTGFLSSTGDPCNNHASVGGTRSANCASEGLPGDFTQTRSITSVTVGGREAGLAAETSKNSSWGIIMQPVLPTGMGSLSLAVDRFDIQVNDGVSQVSTGSILQLCYDDPAFRAGGGFCRLVTRGADNSLTVRNGYVNLSTDIVRGFDYNIRYTNEVGPGRLRVGLSATEFRQKASKLFATDPLTDSNGWINNPKWSGALDINYTMKGWNFYYGAEWVGKTSSYVRFTGVSADPAQSTLKADTPDYFLHSMSLSYSDPIGKWRATFGVRNLEDKAPPVVSAGVGVNRVGNAPLFSGYDYLGRRFFLNVSKTF
jgi:iron complex outermembrane receptor protein